jgi:hypothetical protein
MNVLRACSLLVPSYTFRSIAKKFTSNSNASTVRSVADRFGVKRRSGRFFRNYLIANGLIFGGGTLYYYYYLTTKERRQVRVTFEGFQRGFRLVFDNYLLNLILFV